jgi:hypothetical protein
MTTTTQRIMELAEKLSEAKIRYAPWDGNEWKEEEPPFYFSNKTLAPSIETIKEHGCCCAGLINIVCREMGINIPEGKDGRYSGGMFEWTNQRQWLHIRGKIPILSLVCVPYKSDEEPEGHIGLYLSSNRVLHSTIAKGVHIDDVGDYPWMYVCNSEHWMKSSF